MMLEVKGRTIVQDHSVGDILFSREERNLEPEFFIMLVTDVQLPDLSDRHLSLIGTIVSEISKSIENLDALAYEVIYKVQCVRNQDSYWLPQTYMNKMFRKMRGNE
jgi:hypothetical protein